MQAKDENQDLYATEDGDKKLAELEKADSRMLAGRILCGIADFYGKTQKQSLVGSTS